MNILNHKLIFTDSYINKNVKVLFENSRVQRIDNFEFTFEFKLVEHPSESNFLEILDKVVQLASMNFWPANSFRTDKPKSIAMQSHLELEKPIKVDVFIIKSSETVITFEIHFYQEMYNIFSIVLESKLNEFY